MDALEFARELKRMCESHKNCLCCELYKEVGVRMCDHVNLEEAVPIVEKWSAEHPLVRNVDWVAEQLEKIGYGIDKEEIMKRCPVPYSIYFDSKDKCPDKECNECQKWWDEEYKEQ